MPDADVGLYVQLMYSSSYSSVIMTCRSSLHQFPIFALCAIVNFDTIFIPFVCLRLFSLVELYIVIPPLKTLLLLLETSSVVDKKCHSLQLYYKRAPLYLDYTWAVTQGGCGQLDLGKKKLGNDKKISVLLNRFSIKPFFDL